MGAIIKNASYVVAFWASMTYLNLDGRSVVILAALLLVDFVTGILRAALVDGVQTIKSSIAIRGFISKLLVFLIPFLIAVSGKGVSIDLSAMAQASITVFILSMLYSILGNIRSIQTGQAKQEFDAIQYFIVQVRGLLKSVIHDD